MKTTKKILEEKGNFSTFLEAVEICGYTRLVDGGGLVTIFAPDNDAFAKWLQEEYGTDDIKDVPVDKLSIIVGYHMIKFAYEPKDFLAFTMTSSDDSETVGDGSCYKYKTYARNPNTVYTDPLNGRKVNLFSREKYLPVFSTRLFENRAIPDPEDNYRRFFPDVNWKGMNDQLYAGEAAVLEAGIQSCNGYLYIVDKVLTPAPTVYEALIQDNGKEYSIIKGMFDRIRLYTYDATVTKNYSETGDSLFYFYHWSAPQKAAEIPEIASEWTYHDESGVVFDKALRFSNNCFFPKDEVLEPYLKEYFKEFGTYEADKFLDVIPKNAIYHFLMAHVYGLQDIVLPSELDMGPINGVNGEKFSVSSSDVDVKYCANGVFYGMNKVFEPAVFNYLTEPVFRNPDYTFYSRAFNMKNMYQQTVDPNNRFTLFIQSDEDLLREGYSSSESTTGNMSYSFRQSSGPMSEVAVSNFLMSQFVFGQIPSPGEVHMQRYFVSKDNKTYFYIKDNEFYDATDTPLLLIDEIETDNGIVYQLDRHLPARKGGYAESARKAEFAEFKKLMQAAGLANTNAGVAGSLTGLTDALVFFPTNEAVTAALAAGMIPEKAQVEAEGKVYVDELAKYLKYYFVSLQKNKLSNFLLPGLGPEGMTTEAYEGTYATLSDYVVESDIKYMTIAWDPENSTCLSLTDMGGNTITTVPERVELRTNAAAYAIETCFDYRTMFGTNE